MQGRMDMDEVFERLGGFGRYQLLISVWGSLISMVAGMHVMANYFTTLKPEGHCEDTGNCTNPDWCLETTHARSLVIEFGGCDPPSWMGPWVTSIFFFSWFAGGLVCGRLCDIYGRCNLSFALSLLGAVAYAGSAAVDDIYWYYALTVAHGALTGGLVLIVYILTTESLQTKYQGIIAGCVLGSYALGCLVLVPLAYYVPHWRQLTLVLSLMFAPFLCFFCVLFESPRWLEANGHHLRAVQVLERIAAMNGKKACPVTVEDLQGQGVLEEHEAPGVLEALRVPELLLRGGVMCFSWFTCAITYYGLNFVSGDLGGDLYINSLLVTAVELPTYPLQAWAVDNRFFGRKKTCLIGLAVAALGCFGFTICYYADAPTAGKACAFAGKAGVALSFAVEYVWGSEVFPTDVRATFLGAATAAARIGAVASPQLAAAGSQIALPVFGVLSLVAGLLSLYLPETRGMPLLQTIDELRPGSPGERQTLIRTLV